MHAPKRGWRQQSVSLADLPATTKRKPGRNRGGAVQPTAPLAAHAGLRSNTSDQNNRQRWFIDSMANVFVCSPDDPCVIKRTTIPATLGTSAGPASVVWGVLRTPLGPRRGILSEGAPRLMPSEALGNFSIETTAGKIVATTKSGWKLRTGFLDGFPVCFRSRVQRRPTSAKRCGGRGRSATAVEHDDSEGERLGDVIMFNGGAPAPDNSAPDFRSDYGSSVSDLEPRSLDFGAFVSWRPTLWRSPRSSFKVKRAYAPSSSAGGFGAFASWRPSLWRSHRSSFKSACALSSSANADGGPNHAEHNLDHHPHSPNCEACKLGKLRHVSRKRQDPVNLHDAATVAGERVYGDLCFPWPSTPSGERVLLVLCDEATGLLEGAPLLGKLAGAVQAELLSFKQMLEGVRKEMGHGKPNPWFFKSDPGGEFVELRLRDWLAEQGCVQELGVTGRHVARAERSVQALAQGIRTLLHAASLPHQFWGFAARTFVFNRNCKVQGFCAAQKASGRPVEPRIFGALCYCKLTRDQLEGRGTGSGKCTDVKASKADLPARPCAFLAYTRKARCGAHVLYRNAAGALCITVVDARGIVWPPRPAFAFVHKVRNLHVLSVPGECDSGQEGPVSSNELEGCVDDRDFPGFRAAQHNVAGKYSQPAPTNVDPTSVCPACRGRARRHTHRSGCRWHGVSSAELSKLRSVVVKVPSKGDLLASIIAKRRGELASVSFDAFLEKARTIVIEARPKPKTALAAALPMETGAAEVIGHNPGGPLREVLAGLSGHSQDFPREVVSPFFAGGPTACLTRKMTPPERASPEGQAAMQAEIDKLVKYSCFGKPRSRNDAEPGATVCPLVLLAFIKHAEIKGGEKHKGRAVALGDQLSLVSGDRHTSGEASPWAALESHLAALQDGRLVDIWAVTNGFPLQSVDIENAYLQEKWPDDYCQHYLAIPKEMWRMLPAELRPPPGMEAPVFPMQRCLYGHPASGHLFINGLLGFLRKNGWSAVGRSEKGALLSKGRALVCAYVDDLKASGPESELAELWACLQSRYPIPLVNLECTSFLGHHLARTREGGFDSISLSMPEYVEEVGKVYSELWNCSVRPYSSPISVSLRAYDASEKKPPEKRVQRIVGMLLWVSRSCRPDLAFSASALGSRVSSWNEECDRELARAIGYLVATKDATLTFRWKIGDTPRVVLYTDADWMAPRSQSGFALLVLGDDGASRALLHWGSTKQVFAAESPAAAETAGVYSGLKQASPVADSFVRVTSSQECLPIGVDNAQVIALCKHGYSEALHFLHKATNTRMGFLKDCSARGWIRIFKECTRTNPANLFTKALGGVKLRAELPFIGADLHECRAFRSALWLEHNVPQMCQRRPMRACFSFFT